jgi:hypothetical protein
MDTDKTFFGPDRRLPRHPKGQMLVDQSGETCPEVVLRAGAAAKQRLRL